MLSGDCCVPGLPPRWACYRPPFDEFEVWRLATKAGAREALPAARGPMLLLVQHGDASISTRGGGAREVRRGDVLFVPANLALVRGIWAAAGLGMRERRPRQGASDGSMRLIAGRTPRPHHAQEIAAGKGLVAWFAACNRMGPELPHEL